MYVACTRAEIDLGSSDAENEIIGYLSVCVCEYGWLSEFIIIESIRFICILCLS